MVIRSSNQVKLCPDSLLTPCTYGPVKALTTLAILYILDNPCFYLDSDALVEFDLLVDATATASAVFAIGGALTPLVVALLVAGVGHASVPNLAASTVTAVVQFCINGGGVFTAHATGVKPSERKLDLSLLYLLIAIANQFTYP